MKGNCRKKVFDNDGNDDGADYANDDDDDGDDEENDDDDGAMCRMKDSNTKGIGSV